MVVRTGRSEAEICGVLCHIAESVHFAFATMRIRYAMNGYLVREEQRPILTLEDWTGVAIWARVVSGPWISWMICEIEEHARIRFS